MSSTSSRNSIIRRWWLSLLAVVAMVMATLAVSSPPGQAAPAAAAPAAAAPAAAAPAALCSNFSQTVSMTANVQKEVLLYTQYWPGGTQTIGTAPCTIDVKRPSGRIDLVGALGDHWEVSIPAGSQMQAVSITTVHTPNCTIAGAAGTVEAQRPSCSLGTSFDTQNGSTASLTFNAVANPVLTVDKLGTGGGLVSSAPAGIHCGATCQAQYALGTTVTLTQTANSGSHFLAWGGPCAGGGATCTVTMSQARSVTAAFALNDVSSLSVTKGGGGAGTVTSSPEGINCGPTNSPSCQAGYATGTLVQLSASAAPGSQFAGWAGSGCSGKGSCSVTMDSNKSVVANFTPIPVPTRLTVDRSGSGTGTVTSSPAGIDCGSTCAADFDSGSTVTLTADPDSGSSFEGWSGAGCTGVGPCEVAMSAATTVTATFGSAPVVARPDGLIGVGSTKAIGNGVYNKTGAKQTRSGAAKAGKTVRFAWTVQNDGNARDTMRLSQRAKGSKRLAVSFKAGNKNVTKQVVAGTYAKPLAAGKSLTLTVTVTVKKGTKAGTARSWLLQASSGTDTGKVDVVGVKVNAKR